MTLTRDSIILTLTIVATAAVIPFAHFDKITWLTPEVQQEIELIATVAGGIALYLKSSPLSLSPKGKLDEWMDKASQPTTKFPPPGPTTPPTA